MIWYVAFVAILNLGLGYVVGVRAGRSRYQVAAVGDDAFDHEGI
jgi:hypothetical protein